MKEAAARIKINKLLEAASWRFFPTAQGPANIQLEANAKITIQALDDLGENFEKIKTGFIDFLLLNEKGFGKEVEKNLLEATSPFVFSTVNERTILRLLKLIACDNAKIGTYAKLVDDRNETAHPNGNIFFSTLAALDTKITEILRIVQEIQSHSKPVIEHCYRKFLISSHNTEEREYPDPEDQIREVLIHGNYLSQRDLDICRRFALSDLAAELGFTEIQDLHQALQATYPPTE